MWFQIRLIHAKNGLFASLHTSGDLSTSKNRIEPLIKITKYWQSWKNISLASILFMLWLVNQALKHNLTIAWPSLKAYLIQITLNLNYNVGNIQPPSGLCSSASVVVYQELTDDQTIPVFLLILPTIFIA